MKMTSRPVYSVMVMLVITVGMALPTEHLARKKIEMKVFPTFHMCGDQFYFAWRDCCGRQCKVEITPRLSRTTSLKERFVLPASIASQFLKNHSFHKRTQRKRDNNIFKRSVDAVEECCKEGCSFEEVAEYEC